MYLRLDDVFCPTCANYVHPFLDRCPSCGAERRSRYEEALEEAGLQGPTLLDDPELEAPTRWAAKTQDLIAHRSGAVAAGLTQGSDDGDLQGLIDRLAGSITYRSYGGWDGSLEGDDVSFHVRSDTYQFRDVSSGSTLGEVSPAMVVAVTFLPEGRESLTRWAGIHAGSLVALPSPAVGNGSLLVTFAVEGGYAQVGLGNRNGIFASRGRPDHYDGLARWVGVWSGAASQTRWRRLGAAAHAAELGFIEPGALAAAGPTAPTSAAPGAARSVRDALLELEALRSDGLLSDAEYEAKRREILERL